MTKESRIHKIGILGAGQMGAGIAQTAAQFNFEVFLADQSLEFSEKAKKKIAAQLQKLVEKQKISPQDEANTLERIHPVQGLKEIGNCELVIEAVTEKPELKFQIFRQLDEICSPQALLASNTSSISITAIAAQTK